MSTEEAAEQVLITEHVEQQDGERAGIPCDHSIPLPSAAAVRAYLKSTGWTEQPPGHHGSLWSPPDSSRLRASIGVPFGDSDPDSLRGVLERVARADGRTAAQLARLLTAPGADPEVWNAAAAAIPQEWEDAACAHYSMHGNGLVRNILAGVEPLIRADERERIARFTWDMGVTYTADDGSRLPFADLIREGS
jgi:hypothetical protein